MKSGQVRFDLRHLYCGSNKTTKHGPQSPQKTHDSWISSTRRHFGKLADKLAKFNKQLTDFFSNC